MIKRKAGITNPRHKGKGEKRKGEKRKGEKRKDERRKGEIRGELQNVKCKM